MPMEPNARLLLEKLNALDAKGMNLADAIKEQKEIIASAEIQIAASEEEIIRLEAIADLSKRTETRSPTGRKKRSDANRPRGPRRKRGENEQAPPTEDAPHDNATASEVDQ